MKYDCKNPVLCYSEINSMGEEVSGFLSLFLWLRVSLSGCHGRLSISDLVARARGKNPVHV